ncbi:hypothetical protein PCANC_16908 [Puccinia coronata f. sp. avenae]|uniref:Secreted protein n=1 Tax=Puccinia coronata f. sp. avenae TaxID=200324 RepID=A0A2N5VPD0_9BASI|nr:hypothetical protein PCANC_16908 [Puccinia coronata f. sp. avenae]PLW51861.1 hypothetical protein PCASD_00908 [Puccinia coronata f. sp. avenae]
MLVNPFVIATVITLVARGSFAIDCNPHTLVNPKECQAAISQIVYNQDGTLSPLSKHFVYVNGRCSINVANPKAALTNKKQIETGFDQIIQRCRPGTGGGNLPANQTVFLNIGTRSAAPYAPYQSDFPFLKETCGLNTNAPDTHKDDCWKAYKSVHYSVEGQFLDAQHQETSNVTTTYQSCTVTLETSDGSNIVATNGHVQPVFDTLLAKCNGKSGVVSIPEGAQGPNGRLFLKTKSSVPCGINDPTKQTCY